MKLYKRNLEKSGPSPFGPYAIFSERGVLFHSLGSLSANKRFHRMCLVELRLIRGKKKEPLNHVAITVRLPDSYHVLTTNPLAVFDLSSMCLGLTFIIVLGSELTPLLHKLFGVRERFNSRVSINTVTFIY